MWSVCSSPRIVALRLLFLLTVNVSPASPPPLPKIKAAVINTPQFSDSHYFMLTLRYNYSFTLRPDAEFLPSKRSFGGFASAAVRAAATVSLIPGTSANKVTHSGMGGWDSKAQTVALGGNPTDLRAASLQRMDPQTPKIRCLTARSRRTYRERRYGAWWEVRP